MISKEDGDFPSNHHQKGGSLPLSALFCARPRLRAEANPTQRLTSEVTDPMGCILPLFRARRFLLTTNAERMHIRQGEALYARRMGDTQRDYN